MIGTTLKLLEKQLLALNESIAIWRRQEKYQRGRGIWEQKNECATKAYEAGEVSLPAYKYGCPLCHYFSCSRCPWGDNITSDCSSNGCESHLSPYWHWARRTPEGSPKRVLDHLIRQRSKVREAIAGIKSKSLLKS